jgi:hypothetical protein
VKIRAMAEPFDGDFDRDAAPLGERLDGFAGDPDGLRADDLS